VYLSVGEQIKIILNREKIKYSELAQCLGISRQALWKKFATNEFSVNDVIRIADILGYELVIEFVKKEDACERE